MDLFLDRDNIEFDRTCITAGTYFMLQLDKKVNEFFRGREKSFEKKFAHDEEIQFKVSAKRNKYLGEWVADKLNKKGLSKNEYIQEVIKSDFKEPGDEDVFRKVKNDFKSAGIEIDDKSIREKMIFFLDQAKKEFI